MSLPFAGTYSIVGYDPETKEWGVAVESKFFAIGSVTPWAKAGAGAIATQSYINTTFGPKGLALLAEGKSAGEVLDYLIESDPGRDIRQVGIVDAQGGVANYTGADCFEWAGGYLGDNFSVQGNILVSQATVDAMVEAYLNTTGDLAQKLLEALDAGQKAGGDSRGQQSAALLVVQEAGGYQGFDDRKVDLRVDDHLTPVAELGRLLDIHRDWYPRIRTDCSKV